MSAENKYLPQDRNGRFFRAIEEAGEFLQAVGKGGRFGFDNRHPDRFETNAEEIRRELLDLRVALDALLPDIDAEIARQKAAAP